MSIGDDASGSRPALTPEQRALLLTVPDVPQRAVDTVVPARLRDAGVTAREFEVLTLVARRCTNAEIAGRLYLSPRTVEKHIASLLAKTGAPSRTDLARLAADSDPAGEHGG